MALYKFCIIIIIIIIIIKVIGPVKFLEKAIWKSLIIGLS